MFRKIVDFFSRFFLSNNKYYQGYFKPKYPNKCINIGVGKPPFARSSWETRIIDGSKKLYG